MMLERPSSFGEQERLIEADRQLSAESKVGRVELVFGYVGAQ